MLGSDQDLFCVSLYISSSEPNARQRDPIIRLTPSILFPKVECFFYAISFLPNQLVRSNPADLEPEMRTF